MARSRARYNDPMPDGSLKSAAILCAPLALALALALAMAGCGPPVPPAQPVRVAAPPLLAATFSSFPGGGSPPLEFIPLQPYSRARDLEVLLFSSGSQAFQGVILPARYIPFVATWLDPFDGALPSAVRPDVAESVGGPKRPLCLPLTFDCGAMVVRHDLWSQFGLPRPTSLAALRDAALTLRARRGDMEDVIVSDLPVDELFWDLAWSFEGAPDPELYKPAKVHALKFIQEFGGVRGVGAQQGERDLSDGKAAVLFTSCQRAIELCRSDRRLAPWPIPSTRGRAYAIYSGWCLAKEDCPADVERAIASLMGQGFQAFIRKGGLIPTAAKEDAGETIGGPILDNTTVHGAPMLGASGDEIVNEAILDATQGQMLAEEALRRAAARLQAQGGK